MKSFVLFRTNLIRTASLKSAEKYEQINNLRLTWNYLKEITMVKQMTFSITKGFQLCLNYQKIGTFSFEHFTEFKQNVHGNKHLVRNVEQT